MNAIYSKVNIQQANQQCQFYNLVDDLINHPKVNQLNLYTQHLNTSRLQHSLNVAYYSFLFSKRFKMNIEETVRAALLHDFFLYEWRSEQPVAGSHLDVHPQQALLNAKTITNITPLMEDVILSHMWPLGAQKPKSKEAWMVSVADKLCTMMELTHQITAKSKRWAFSPMMVSLLLFVG
jgi:uncharacterized protein